MTDTKVTKVEEKETMTVAKMQGKVYTIDGKEYTVNFRRCKYGKKLDLKASAVRGMKMDSNFEPVIDESSSAEDVIRNQSRPTTELAKIILAFQGDLEDQVSDEIQPIIDDLEEVGYLSADSKKK